MTLLLLAAGSKDGTAAAGCAFAAADHSTQQQQYLQQYLKKGLNFEVSDGRHGGCSLVGWYLGGCYLSFRFVSFLIILTTLNLAVEERYLEYLYDHNVR